MNSLPILISLQLWPNSLLPFLARPLKRTFYSHYLDSSIHRARHLGHHPPWLLSQRSPLIMVTMCPSLSKITLVYLPCSKAFFNLNITWYSHLATNSSQPIQPMAPSQSFSINPWQYWPPLTLPFLDFLPPPAPWAPLCWFHLSFPCALSSTATTFILLRNVRAMQGSVLLI